MTSDLDLRGVWVPLITPFDAAGAVDVDAIERLCHEYLAAGAAGIVALGTTGESSALDEVEKRAVIDACATRVHFGARAVDRRHRYEQHAHDRCRDERGSPASPASSAALVVVPYYVRPSEAGIVAHIQTVADASPVPIVLYNIPYRTGRGLGAAALLELAAHPNIAGREAGGRRTRHRHVAAAGRSAARVRGARRRGPDPVPDHVHGWRRARSRRRRTSAPSGSSR